MEMTNPMTDAIMSLYWRGVTSGNMIMVTENLVNRVSTCQHWIRDVFQLLTSLLRRCPGMLGTQSGRSCWRRSHTRARRK